MDSLLKHILLQKSYVRYCMNKKLRDQRLTGRVLDVGGGKLADYHNFMPRSPNTSLVVLDMVSTAHSQEKHSYLSSKKICHNQ